MAGGGAGSTIADCEEVCIESALRLGKKSAPNAPGETNAQFAYEGLLWVAMPRPGRTFLRCRFCRDKNGVSARERDTLVRKTSSLQGQDNLEVTGTTNRVARHKFNGNWSDETKTEPDCHLNRDCSEC